MDIKLIEANYKLLPSEDIPDCCASCKHLGFLITSFKLDYVCIFGVNDSHRKEPKVCLFGLCDNYKRRKDIQ